MSSVIIDVYDSRVQGAVLGFLLTLHISTHVKQEITTPVNNAKHVKAAIRSNIRYHAACKYVASVLASPGRSKSCALGHTSFGQAA